MQSCSAGCETGVSTSAPNISASVTEAQSTVSIQLQGPIDPYRFNMFMADLLAERGSDIKRMYGVLTVQVRFPSSSVAHLCSRLSSMYRHIILTSTCQQHKPQSLSTSFGVATRLPQH